MINKSIKKKMISRVMAIALAMGIGISSVVAGTDVASAKEKKDFTLEPIYEAEQEAELNIYTNAKTKRSYLPGVRRSYLVDGEGKKHLDTKSVYKYNSKGQLTMCAKTYYPLKTEFNEKTGKYDIVKTDAEDTRETYVIKYKYKNDRLVKKIRYIKSVGEKDAAITTYKYKANKIVISYPVVGNEKSVLQKIYNKKNQLIEDKYGMYCKLKSGKWEYTEEECDHITYKYDKKGNYISKKGTGFEVLQNEYKASYDDNGNILSSSDVYDKNTWDGPESKDETYTYEFYENGKPKVQLATGTEISYWSYREDEDGNMNDVKGKDYTRKTHYNKYGKCLSEVLKYDDEADVRTVTKYKYKKGLILTSFKVTNKSGITCDSYVAYGNFKTVKRKWN